MNQARQKLMYLALGAFVLYFGGDYAMRNYVDGPLEQIQNRKEQLSKKLKKRKKELAEAKAAAKKLDLWEKSSLPSDSEVARSVYRTWLLDLVEKSEFHTAHVDSGPANSRKGIYDALTFSVRAKGTLDHVVKFLFEFYQAGHLHKIQSLNLTPLSKTSELDVVMTIEALILPGADRKKELSTVRSNRLAHHQMTDYGVISQRNFFGVGGGADESRQAILTAITQENGEPEIWITLRGQDKLLRLRKGGKFEIGPFAGIVIDILDDDAVIESVGERWLISVGEALADALAVPPEY